MKKQQKILNFGKMTMKGRKEVKTDCFILKKFLYFDRLN